ncbi:MAG: protein kinase [Acidobacteria bacterium]|nr:protein kinase [Acidobacteriota bacterium]
MRPGARLGPYEIVAPLGAGGMGEVYRAHDTRLGRDVAIKVLPVDVAADPDRLARFEREARTLAALSHPSILGIFDVGSAPVPAGDAGEGPAPSRAGAGPAVTTDAVAAAGTRTVHYLVTELLEGTTLGERLRRERLPWGTAVEIVASIADGLGAAHGKGIVHRDLKPDNVFLTSGGRVKLLDFGLARQTRAETGAWDQAVAPTETSLTEVGAILGTVGYMAPEQVRGFPTDHRSDIFALGCVLYEALTGKPPFRRDTAAETMTAILKEAAADPSSVVAGVLPELDRLVARCLAKQPGERFQSASDLAYALRAVAAPADSPHASLHRARDDRPSIAVLPFANLSADPEQEYFCDGMAEEILNALAHVQGLRVIARTSAFAFKGRNEDIREIGRRLDVATLLEGSVRKAGDRLRITAQLISVADGSHLWSERYDRRLEDVFAIQDEIALAIVGNLEVRLRARERAAIGQRPAENLEAYSAYLRGQYHWNRLSPEGFARSRQYFEEAISADSRYAPAYTGLGMWFISLAFWADFPPQEAWRRGCEAFGQALSLDPDSAMAHVGMGTLLGFFERRWQAGEENLRRGVALGPGAAAAHMNLAAFLAIRGRWAEAAAAARVSLRLAPLSVPSCAWNAGWLDAAGQHGEARAELEKAIALDPAHWLPHWELSLALARLGRAEESCAEAEEAVRLSGRASVAVAIHACACYARGDVPMGEALRAQLEERDRTGYVPPGLLALIDVARGELDAAARRLEASADSKDPWLCTFRTLPASFGPDQARIDALLARFDL